MGFDLFIHLHLPIDEKTGLPFVYDTNSCRQPYVPSDFLVPEKYRLWLKQRGHHFHYYIRDIDGSHSMDTISVEAFLDKYPDWEDVKYSMSLDGEDEESYQWTEDNHTSFKEALQWFSSKSNFSITWSY
jgi:hypothetical protein